MNMMLGRPGGVHDIRGNQNSGEIESLARFAIQEQNNRENKVLELKKIVKAREQVVAGIMYYLTLEAKEGDKTKNFEAKVWVQAWMNFKQLEEFKELIVILNFTCSKLIQMFLFNPLRIK